MAKRVRRQLGSPAMLVALVALTAALAGSAVGLPGRNKVDRNDLRKGVVRTKHLGRGSVVSVKIRNRAVRLADIAVGARGPHAYAYVLGAGPGGGNVDESRSKGVTDSMVSSGGTDNESVCFDLPFAPRHAQATAAIVDNSAIVDVHVEVGGANPGLCGAGFEAAAALYDGTGKITPAKSNFYIAFYD